MGHMAEAIMTKSFINSRAQQYFEEKEEVCDIYLVKREYFVILKALSGTQSRIKSQTVVEIKIGLSRKKLQ